MSTFHVLIVSTHPHGTHAEGVDGTKSDWQRKPVVFKGLLKETCPGSDLLPLEGSWIAVSLFGELFSNHTTHGAGFML